MLRRTACFLITVFLFVLLIVGPPRVESFANLQRLTNTSEHAVNLNPVLSDDGRTVVFESSADLADSGGTSFHALRADITASPPAFADIASTRAVCPALSRDGKLIVFASTEDLVGKNADRNSEIFLFEGSKLDQLTRTEPDSSESRL